MNKPTVVQGVELTLLDANHCPGAVMFVFRLKDGRVYLHVGIGSHTSLPLSVCVTRNPPLCSSLEYHMLHTHTGDFRWHTGMTLEPVLRQYAAGAAESTKRIHTLYLDTTYCNPKYAFPSQVLPPTDV